MAVAQAQYPVAEIAEKLRAAASRCALASTWWRGVCQPANVLLAEAKATTSC